MKAIMNPVHPRQGYCSKFLKIFILAKNKVI
jgi:hypothetical protein